MSSLPTPTRAERAEDSWLTDEQHQRVEALRAARGLLAARGLTGNGPVADASLIRVAWWILDGRDTYIDGPPDNPHDELPEDEDGAPLPAERPDFIVPVDVEDLRRLNTHRQEAAARWMMKQPGNAADLLLAGTRDFLEKYAAQLADRG